MTVLKSRCRNFARIENLQMNSDIRMLFIVKIANFEFCFDYERDSSPQDRFGTGLNGRLAVTLVSVASEFSHQLAPFRRHGQKCIRRNAFFLG
jgi:hypothetical protein